MTIKVKRTPWFPVDSGALHHFKLKQLVRMLTKSTPARKLEVQGAWLSILCMVAHSGLDGRLDGFTPSRLAVEIDWEHDPEALVNALLGCGVDGGRGLLYRDAGGVLCVNSWEEYAGAHAARRKKDADRKRREREEAAIAASTDHAGQSPPSEDAASAGEPMPDKCPLSPDVHGRPGMSMDISDKAMASANVPAREDEMRGDETRQEKSKTSPSSPSGRPETDLGEPWFEKGWGHHRDSGASIDGGKRTKGNCAWKQWCRFLRVTGLSPEDACGRWMRMVDLRGRFTKAPLRLLNPDKGLLTDEALADAEKNARARAGPGPDYVKPTLVETPGQREQRLADEAWERAQAEAAEAAEAS